MIEKVVDMSIPKISIIIPVFRVEKYIERCVRSLFEQTIDDIEYIFINDCTPDNSMMILSNLIEQYPHRKSQVKIIHHNINKGVSAARNAGLKASTGKYIIYCDSDDWIEKDMYKSLYDKAIAEDADIVGCDFYYEYNKKSIYCKQYFDQEIELCFQQMLYGAENLEVSLWNRLIKKDLYVSYNIRFPEGVNIGEDLVVTLQVHYFAHKISYIPKAFYHYTKYNVNSIVSCIREPQFEEMLKFCQVIELFLHQYNIYEQYYMSFMERVFRAKWYMIDIKSLRDFELWHILWPGSNQLIWCYHIPLYYKIVFSLINKELYFLAINMFAVRRSIGKLKSKIILGC